MPTTNKTIHRITVTLRLPTSVPALITYTRSIVDRLTNNPSLRNPTPTLAALTAAVDDLQTAEAAALARTKGAVATRNDKRAAVVSLLHELRGYIEVTANADPSNAAAVIESTGLTVRRTPTRHARAFAAKPGPVSGVATLTAKSVGRRGAYEWEYSTDGGKTWIAAPATLQAKTKIAGLVPGATVLFKCRPVTKTGEGDWSQPVSLLVQ